MRNLPARLAAAVLLACLALIVSASARAQASEEEEEVVGPEAEAPRTEFRQELVVVATHPELPSEAIYSGREIEQEGGEDIGYFLRSQTGVSSFRRGPIGLDPQVRGLQETQIGVFVDGTRTFAAGPGRMDSELAHVSPRAVERMRVVKGPYALTWGAGTMSAIQLETFRPPFGSGDFDLGGRAGGAYGDNASATDAYAALWGSGESLRLQALLQRREGDDYQDANGNRVPGDYESGDARWSLGTRLGDHGVLEYSGGYQQQKDIDYPGRPLDADYFYTRSQALEGSWNLEAGKPKTLFGRIYVNRKDHRMNNHEKPTAQPNPSRIPPFGIRVDLPTESNTAGGNFSVAGGRKNLRWQAGLDAYRLEQTARRTISRRDNDSVLFEHAVWPDVSIEDVGGYFQMTRTDGDRSLAATIRADQVDAAAGEVSDFFRDNTTGELGQSETNLSAAVSSRFRLSDSWVLSAGAGRAVRTANAAERYSDRLPSSKFQIGAEFVGDPEIDPEKALQIDLGVEFRTQSVVFQVDGYHRVIDDFITVMPDPDLAKRLPMSPPTVFRYINGDEATFYGGEARFRHRLGDRFEWRAQASYIRGKDELFDEPAFGMPPLTARLGAQARPVAWCSIHANVTIVDAQNRVASARFEQPTPGYSLLDLLAVFDPSADWRLTAGVENLGDKQYVNHLNSMNPFTGQRIPEQGRSVTLSAEYHF